NGLYGSAFHVTGNDPLNSLTENSFGKAGSMGDMVALIAAAPIEIGNRVWLDTNGNGIQDPGGAPIPGVTGNLYAPSSANPNTPIETAVTDAGGNYFFSNGPGTTTASALYNVALNTFSTYSVRIDNPADFTGAGPLTGLFPTVAGAGTDRGLDS